MKLNTENLRVHPEMLAVLYARARRARAVAVHNIFVRLFDRLTPRLSFRPWGAHWG